MRMSARHLILGLIGITLISVGCRSRNKARSNIKTMLGDNIDIGRGFVTQDGSATGGSCLAFERGDYKDADRYADLTHGQELPQAIRLSYADQAKLGLYYRTLGKNGNAETNVLTGNRKTQVGADKKVMPLPIDAAQWTYQVIEHSDQLAQALDVKLKAKYNAAGGAASATMSANFAQNSAFSHKKTQVLLDTRIYSHSIVMDTHADLNQNYIVKIGKSFWPTVGSQDERIKGWQGACGNHYVSSINYGASLSILLELDMDQSEFTRQTNLEMSGKGTFATGDAKASMSFSQAISKLTSNRRVLVKGFMIGGTPITKAGDEKIIFTITDLAGLEQHVRSWVTETVSGALFAPISYETASYATVNGWNELQNSIKLSDGEYSTLAEALKYVDELLAFSKSVQDVVRAPFAFATKLNEKDDGPLWSDAEEKELKQLSPKTVARLVSQKVKYENRATNIRRMTGSCWATNFNESDPACEPYFKMFGKSSDDIDRVAPIVGLRAEIETEVALLPRRVRPVLFDRDQSCGYEEFPACRDPSHGAEMTTKPDQRCPGSTYEKKVCERKCVHRANRGSPYWGYSECDAWEDILCEDKEKPIQVACEVPTGQHVSKSSVACAERVNGVWKAKAGATGGVFNYCFYLNKATGETIKFDDYMSKLPPVPGQTHN